MDMIGYDSYFQHDRAKVYIPQNTPVNKREVPCDGCPFADQCGEADAECSAFRSWTTKGNYDNAEIAKHVRPAK